MTIMQHRSLTLQESFGLKPIQSFSDARGTQVKIGSYDVGGKVPNSILKLGLAKPLMIPSPQTPYEIASNDVAQRRCDYYIIAGSIVLVLMISIIVYHECQTALQDEPASSRKPFNS
jgi:hypothetical protein